jgi:hypothetical protein
MTLGGPYGLRGLPVASGGLEGMQVALRGLQVDMGDHGWPVGDLIFTTVGYSKNGLIRFPAGIKK